MNPKRLALIAFLALAVGLFFWLDLGRYLDFAFLKSQHQALVAYREAHPLLSSAVFFLLYVAVTALSLPGAVIMTLAAGAIFGLLWGLVLVSFASSIGATAAMLVARYLLREGVRRRFGQRLAAVDAGLVRDGFWYLFSLRLVPIFPFFVINLLFGLTAMGAGTFYWVSQIGMLPGTLVYINAGTQLAQLEGLKGILAPGLWLSFVLLGIFPFIARRLVNLIQTRRIYARWPKPRRFDRNLVVIGAGAAGLVTSYIAAAVKAKVTLIEGQRMGGDCLNTGCVPSKAIIRSAKLLHQARHAAALGIKRLEVDFDFAEVMARVHRVIRTVEPHDSVERYTALGVEVIQGRARITSPWTVEVTTPDGQRSLATRAIVIAAGAEPQVASIPGLEEVGYLTSDSLWGLQELPRRLVVLGGGPIGCELAQAFARLGSEVSLVQRGPRLLPKEDLEVSIQLRQALEADGIHVLTEHQPLRCERRGEAKHIILRHREGESDLEFDVLLCALGRVARTRGYGLEELGIPLNPQRTIETDAYLRTLYPNIFACGDVAGPYQFTHAAGHQAWYAAVNALFGQFKGFRVDYSVIPWTTFTDPEVAHVGLNEQTAKEQGILYEVTRYDLEDLDRAIADGTAHGFVKVLTSPGRDRILGVTIVGEHAGDLLAEFVLAMRHGLGLNKILSTVHTYPTLSEANKYAAGAWKRAHAPAALLRWIGRYHQWRLGG